MLKREKHAKRDGRLAPDIVNDEGKSEACCRRGELLALHWRDIDLQKRELVVRAEDEGARKTG